VVQEALDQLLQAKNNDMTTVIVAHRLRTVRNADCIAFLEGGRVVEQGTHDELLQAPTGRYKRMVERAGSNGVLNGNTSYLTQKYGG
jgi:ABC-type multidrug transport system fused ATPase/permease subunit